MARKSKSEFNLTDNPFQEYGGEELIKPKNNRKGEGTVIKPETNNQNKSTGNGNNNVDEKNLQKQDAAVAVADKPSEPLEQTTELHAHNEERAAHAAPPSLTNMNNSFYKKFEKKKGIDQTHIRQTYYINRELNEIFNLVSVSERKGYKTFVVNEALRVALINVLKEQGYSDNSNELQTLYNLAPEGE